MSAFDLLAGALWLRRLPIRESDEPAIVRVMKKKVGAREAEGSVAIAMARVREMAMATGGIRLGDMEDPFLIIQVIRLWMERYRPREALVPICESGCGGDGGCARIAGDLLYEKSEATMELTQSEIICGRCGRGGVPRVEFLP